MTLNVKKLETFSIHEKIQERVEGRLQVSEEEVS
jgi:hypothetical protein